MCQRKRHRSERHIAARSVAPMQRPAHAVRVPHESGDEWIAWLFVQLARRAFLRDHRLVHHDDPVGNGHRLGLIVRHVNDREREPPLQVANLFAHLPAQTRIQIRQRLIEQQHRGLEHQRARHGDALLLATGQLRWQPRVEAGQADRRHCRSRAVVGFGLAHARHDQAVANVLQHAHVGKERIALEHHRDVPVGRRCLRDIDVADANRAGRW